MPSLDDHFRALTKVPPPSDWPDIAALPLRLPHRGGHRLVAAALALAVAAAGIGFAIWALGGASPSPHPRPAATVGNGKIAFVYGVDDHHTINLVDSDGADPTPLVQGSSPAWSPDGSTLAFVEESGGENDRYIATVSADGSDVQRLIRLQGQPGGIGPQAWSPDGTRIVYASYDGIHVMSADGTGSQLVAHYEGQHVCSDLHPSWSPSGDTIVFAVMCEGGNEGIWTVGVDGTGRLQLIGGSYERDEYRSPVWSPDGTEVAFVKTEWRLSEPIKDASIHVVNADGIGATRLASGVAFDRSIAWSPDGRVIAFTRYHEGGSDIFAVDRRSGGVTQITQTGDAADPAWQPVPAGDGSPAPEPTAILEGTISLPADAIPEGALLVQTDAGAEVLRAGSERSVSVPGVRTPLDLSADGSSVLGSNGEELVATDLLSGQSRILIRPDGDDVLGGFASWSPDGSMVAYGVGAGDPAQRSTLCVLALPSGEPRCFPELGRVYTFDWSADGSRLVVAGPPVQPVRILDVATGGVLDVVPQEGDTPINDAIRHAGMGTSFQLVGPRWSPSGTYLAALANLRDSESAYVPVVFTPEGRFVAFGRASGEYPEPFAWSPVADVLAYTRGEAPYRVTEAYLLDPATGEDRPLVSGEGTEPPFVLTDMAWASSGRRLAIAGWDDQGQGRFRTSLRVLDVADPSSFGQFSVDTGEVYDFIADWGP